MLPNLLDDLMRAWDIRGPAEEDAQNGPHSDPGLNPIEIGGAGPAEPKPAVVPVCRKFVAVTLDSQRLAVPVDSVVEAASYPRTTRVPGLPEYVRGVFNFRGEVLPVIDVKALSGGELAANPMELRILTIQSVEGLTRAAFVFDSLDGILNLDEGPAEIADPESALAKLQAGTGLHKDGGMKYALLDPTELLRAAGCFDEVEAA